MAGIYSTPEIIIKYTKIIKTYRNHHVCLILMYASKNNYINQITLLFFTYFNDYEF